MNCDQCIGGLRPLEWLDAKPDDPQDFAVCLCDAGQAYRRETNEGRRTVPLWRVWCALHQVEPSRVRMIEDVWSLEELAAVGLGKFEPVTGSREAALLAAGRRRKSDR